MAETTVVDELNMRDRVMTAEALPGVPAGTRGRVILKNGFSWVRYRVLFETDEPNGTDVGSLDRAQLIRCDRKWNPLDPMPTTVAEQGGA